MSLHLLFLKISPGKVCLKLLKYFLSCFECFVSLSAFPGLKTSTCWTRSSCWWPSSPSTDKTSRPPSTRSRNLWWSCAALSRSENNGEMIFERLLVTSILNATWFLGNAGWTTMLHQLVGGITGPKWSQFHFYSQEEFHSMLKWPIFTWGECLVLPSNILFTSDADGA